MNIVFEEALSSDGGNNLSEVSTASGIDREWDSTEGTVFSDKTISFSTVEASICPANFEIDDDGSVSTSVPPLLGPDNMSDLLSSYDGHVCNFSTDNGSTNSLVESVIGVGQGRPRRMVPHVYDGVSV